MQRAVVFGVKLTCASDRAVQALDGMRRGGDGDPAHLNEREQRQTMVLSASPTGMDVVFQACKVIFGGGPEEWAKRNVELQMVQSLGAAMGETEPYSPTVALASALPSGPVGVVR